MAPLDNGLPSSGRVCEDPMQPHHTWQGFGSLGADFDRSLHMVNGYQEMAHLCLRLKEASHHSQCRYFSHPFH